MTGRNISENFKASYQSLFFIRIASTLSRKPPKYPQGIYSIIWQWLVQDVAPTVAH